MGICDKCGERLIEIDYYGERLTAAWNATSGDVLATELTEGRLTGSAHLYGGD